MKLTAMQGIAPDAKVVLSRRDVVPGLVPENNGGAERIARQITGDNGTHAVSYATEAGQFQAAGFSAVICGPGSIDQAHQPDEFIKLDQVSKGWDFVQGVTKALQ